MSVIRLFDLNQADFESEKLNQLAEIEFDKLVKKYGNPSCGRHRATFFSKHCVIKFPLNFKGLTDNSYEAKNKDETHAKTKLFDMNDFTCAVQEKLRMPSKEEFKKLPSWTDFIDCQQVGFDKKGNIKAYDFGYF